MIVPVLFSIWDMTCVLVVGLLISALGIASGAGIFKTVRMMLHNRSMRIARNNQRDNETNQRFDQVWEEIIILKAHNQKNKKGN